MATIHCVHGFCYLPELSPAIAARTPRIALGDFPTPVSAIRTPAGTVFVKHDEQAHPRYGGNKLRKLEFLLADAIARERRVIATFGAAGSNHALATALHGKALGLRTIAFLSRQARTPATSATLAAHVKLGTRLTYLGHGGERRRTLRETLRPLHGNVAVIPMGGSSWLGVLGFIAAAAELRAQIAAGALPMPTRIVLPLGTMSTAIGLALGLALTRLPVRVTAVRVVDRSIANPERLRRLGDAWSGRLTQIDPQLDCGSWWQRIDIDESQFGKGYAKPTAASRAALDVAANAGLTLENTYSGKAFAALLATLADAGGPTLFWNTYAGKTPSLPSYGVSPTVVPAELAYLSSGGSDGLSVG
ncbi:MAG: pyridoxal-phosphate dependent enzyme [Pseudomonadota bacterium]